MPVIGGDSGIWGASLNNGVMSYLDNILGATQPIAITSADVTLSINQWNNAAIQLTGTLTGSHNLILPLNANSTTAAVGGLFVVENNTSGAFQVTVTTAASGATGVTVPQGVRTFLYSDTVNVWNADDAKVQIIPFSGNPNGSVAGTAASINTAPSVVWDYTNGVLYICSTTGTTATAVWVVPSQGGVGFNTASNLQLSASVNSNILTVSALAANTGTSAVTGNPIIIPFRSATITNGSPVYRSVTTALSVDTNAIGATLASINSAPFRFWVAALDDTTGLSGKVQLALINCSVSNQVECPSESSLVSSTAMSASATAALTFYTETGVTITNKPWRILGYIEYANGLTTAGTYNNPPTITQLFGPGSKKPGDTVQSAYFLTTAQVNINSLTPLVTTLTKNITLTSSANAVKVQGSYNVAANSGVSPSMQFQRGSSLIGILQIGGNTTVNGSTNIPGSQVILDLPSSITTTVFTYALYINTNRVDLLGANFNQGILVLDEIMG